MVKHANTGIDIAQHFGNVGIDMAHIVLPLIEASQVHPFKCSMFTQYLLNVLIKPNKLFN